jgi:hypothetical protein
MTAFHADLLVYSPVPRPSLETYKPSELQSGSRS